MYFENNDRQVFLWVMKNGGVWHPLESTGVRCIPQDGKYFSMPPVSPPTAPLFPKTNGIANSSIRNSLDFFMMWYYDYHVVNTVPHSSKKEKTERRDGDVWRIHKREED